MYFITALLGVVRLFVAVLTCADLAHAGDLRTVHEVVHWLENSVMLPQYADRFSEAQITGYLV